jgi:hypothetical protein
MRKNMCDTCQYFIERDDQRRGPGGVIDMGRPKVGECRRYPPNAFLIPSGTGMMNATAFPIVQADTHWCGEHVPSVIGGGLKIA